jgi:hypothetical protein
VEEGETGGNILYSGMKVEIWELLKLFQECLWENKGEGGEFNYDIL